MAEPELVDLLITKIRELEENMLKDILRKLLKREPVLEDAKDLTKFYQEGEISWYWLVYKNMKLGLMRMDQCYLTKVYSWTFEPVNGGDFLEKAISEDGAKVTF